MTDPESDEYREAEYRRPSLPPSWRWDPYEREDHDGDRDQEAEVE